MHACMHAHECARVAMIVAARSHRVLMWLPRWDAWHARTRSVCLVGKVALSLAGSGATGRRLAIIVSQLKLHRHAHPCTAPHVTSTYMPRASTSLTALACGGALSLCLTRSTAECYDYSNGG